MFAVNLLDRMGEAGLRWSRRHPWTNVYGIARTLLALAGAATLAFSPVEALFRPAVGVPTVPACSGVASLSLYCQMPEMLGLARWLAIAGLLVVASGWRPRITGVLHWWIAFSLPASAVTVDGGDHAAAVLALILIPMTLADGRRWHWTSLPQSAPETAGQASRRLVGWASWWVARLQVAFIYFQAGVAKCAVEQWADGTALYYWLTEPSFGVTGWLQPVVMPLIHNAVTLPLLTWSVIVVEIGLAAGLLLPRRYWGRLLWIGLGLHAGIALLHGLISFSLTMSGALVLFLRPLDEPVDRAPLDSALQGVRATWRRLRGVRRPAPAEVRASQAAVSGEGTPAS